MHAKLKSIELFNENHELTFYERVINHVELEMLYNKLIDLFHLAFQVRFFCADWIRTASLPVGSGSPSPPQCGKVYPQCSSPETLSPYPIPKSCCIQDWTELFPTLKGPHFFLFSICKCCWVFCWKSFNILVLTCNLCLSLIFFGLHTIHWAINRTWSFHSIFQLSIV